MPPLKRVYSFVILEAWLLFIAGGVGNTGMEMNCIATIPPAMNWLVGKLRAGVSMTDCLHTYRTYTLVISHPCMHLGIHYFHSLQHRFIPAPIDMSTADSPILVNLCCALSVKCIYIYIYIYTSLTMRNTNWQILGCLLFIYIHFTDNAQHKLTNIGLSAVERTCKSCKMITPDNHYWTYIYLILIIKGYD